MKKLALGMIVLLLQHGTAWAILGVADTAIVNDPIQTIQSTLSAIRAAVSNVNETTQINQQLQSLANEAKQLATLPMNLTEQIAGTMGEYSSLLNQGQGIAYQIRSSVEQFEALYAQGGSGNFMQRAAAMLGQMRQAGMIATQATAVFDRLCAQQTRVQQLLGASASATGQLQAQQANNQLMGVLADQQASLQQVLAATGRLQVSEAMQQMVQQEQAHANMQNFLQGTEALTPFNGRGQGFRLPD
jgi:P-type conjugative transfer protein TrbJ